MDTSKLIAARDRLFAARTGMDAWLATATIPDAAAEFIEAAADLTGAMRDEIERLQRELDAARETNRNLHRRTQQIESEVATGRAYVSALPSNAGSYGKHFVDLYGQYGQVVKKLAAAERSLSTARAEERAEVIKLVEQHLTDWGRFFGDKHSGATAEAACRLLLNALRARAEKEQGNG